MKEYSLVAMGGTFDIIHKGHIALISKAFLISDQVMIGLTSDDFARNKGKKIFNSYRDRLDNLQNVINEMFPKSKYQIIELKGDFGPAVLEESVKALIVSEETQDKGGILNEMRAKRGIPPVDVIIVPIELAQDNNKISTTRIRNSEIDINGNILKS